MELEMEDIVAILILLELTLQFNKAKKDFLLCSGRNPYFIGINSAIYGGFLKVRTVKLSQSLFYWN